MRGLLVGVSTIAIAGCARPPPAPVVIEPRTVEAGAPGPATPLVVWFGAWNDDLTRFERTLRFRRVAGESFGWRMKVRCTQPVRFKEVMRLPAPGDWSALPEDLRGTTISEDRTTTTTIDYAACKQGWIEHVWSVSAGDPAGTYVITLEVDGHAPQTFRPRFVDP